MQNRLPALVIMLTVIIDAMGIGLILPVMPDLIREVTGGDLRAAAIWGGVLATVFAFMQFLCGPLLGNLSDRFGRRPILLISLRTPMPSVRSPQGPRCCRMDAPKQCVPGSRSAAARQPLFRVSERRTQDTERRSQPSSDVSSMA